MDSPVGYLCIISPDDRLYLFVRPSGRFEYVLMSESANEMDRVDVL